jgi:hypothetical protein
MENKILSSEEAYEAMFNYLENLYFLTNSDDLGGFLGSMTLLPDGKPIDPAIWNDWRAAVQKVIDGRVKSGSGRSIRYDLKLRRASAHC